MRRRNLRLMTDSGAVDYFGDDTFDHSRGLFLWISLQRQSHWMMMPRRQHHTAIFCSRIRDNPDCRLVELKIHHIIDHPPETIMLMLIHPDPEFDEGHSGLAGTIVSSQMAPSFLYPQRLRRRSPQGKLNVAALHYRCHPRGTPDPRCS